MLADRLAQRDLAQPCARGGRALRLVRRAAVEHERLGEASEPFHHAPLQHGSSASRSLRRTERVEFTDQRRGAAEIAHLDGGTHRFLERQSLQFERQRRGRRSSERNPSRASTHFPCCASASARHRAMSLRLATAGWLRSFMASAPRPSMMLAIARSTSVVESSLGALVGRRDVEHALGFRGQVARQIEAGKLQLRRRTLRLARRRRRRRPDGSGGRGSSLHDRSPMPADRAHRCGAPPHPDRARVGGCARAPRSTA